MLWTSVKELDHHNCVRHLKNDYDLLSQLHLKITKSHCEHTVKTTKKII